VRIETFSLTPGSRPGQFSPTESTVSNSGTTLVLAFGDPDRDRVRGLFEQLMERFPGAHVLGCSTAGEIVGDTVVDHTLSGAIVHFEQARLQGVCVAVPGPDNSLRAGSNIGEQLASPDLRAVIVLSDGLHVNGSELVRGLNQSLAADVVVTGGLAADGDRFGSTWVFADGELQEGKVAAVGLYGEVQVGHGSFGGWDIFGPVRTVTSATGNVLYELDGRPALELYKEYLGERAVELPGSALLFPLAIQNESRGEEPTVRTVLAVDEQTDSLTFAGDIPQGARVRLMRANFDRLIDGAQSAAATAAHLAPSTGPLLSLAISCVGRRLVLGQRAEEELEAAISSLPRGASQVGFYSYGELSPLASGRCELHNQTMTMTTIWERTA
jgi:hypothetical protein